MKTTIIALILILTVQANKVDEPKPIPIPAEHSTELRIRYDAALRAEYEFMLAEERYRSAKQKMSVTMESYQGALSAARKASGAPDNAEINGPIFTEFVVPKDSQKVDKAPSKQ
jgi:hypothetical protein